MTDWLDSLEVFCADIGSIERGSFAWAPAWASNVGASVMATGIVQAAWLLDRLRRECPETDLHLEWEPFAAARSGLLLWETFVSGSAKGASHEEDAEIGVKAFCVQLPSPGDPATLRLSDLCPYWPRSRYGLTGKSTPRT